ncbi:MAG: class I SAM-dependent methyltransferase [Tepidisphaeraceae bacterium]
MTPAAAEFDQFRHTYRQDLQSSLALTGGDVDFFTQVKAQVLIDLCRRGGGDPLSQRGLDVGCGVGLTDAHLAGRVGALDGVDISSGSIQAAARANPWVRYRTYDGGALPYDDGAFDFAFAICVFHHVPLSARGPLASEMARVVRPGGLVVIMEHNPFNPLTQYIVAECPFDRTAQLLPMYASRRLVEDQGLRIVHDDFILIFPFRGRWFRAIEHKLRRAPLGAQYCVAGQVPAGGRGASRGGGDR